MNIKHAYFESDQSVRGSLFESTQLLFVRRETARESGGSNPMLF